MNWEQIEGKWNQLKGAVKQRWGKLTDDDLEVIAGKKDELLGKPREKYGITKEEAERQLEQWSAQASRTSGARAAIRSASFARPSGTVAKFPCRTKS